MERAIGFYPTGREFESLRGCVNNKYDTEKDEVIKPRKRQVAKEKTKKSNHKHEWVVVQYEDKTFTGVVISKYKTVCSVCNKEKS